MGAQMGSFSSTEEQQSRLADDEPRIVNVDGKRLYEKIWMPEKGEPKAVVYVNHGFAEHISVYDEFARALAEDSYLVVGHDHIGHGKSDGVRVDCENFSIFDRDVVQHVKLLKEKYDALPFFLFGHSLGGLISLKTVLQEPNLFRGAVFSAPFLIPFDGEVGRFKRFMVQVAAKVHPQYEISSEKPSIYMKLGSGRGNVEKALNDPLAWQGNLKARIASCAVKAGEEVVKQLDEITLPFLALHGTDDKLVNIEGTKLLYEKSQSKDKELKIYDDYTHHLIREPEELSSVVVRDVKEWLAKHMTEE